MRIRSHAVVVACLAVAALPGELDAQNPVRYDIRFPDAVHHEAEVDVVFPEVGEAPLEVVMSAASPGRYARHGFAKNVYRIEARDGAGRTLEVRRIETDAWRVEGHDGTVVFSYTLFGDHADGTFSGIDRTHAHLNMPASFVWARGLEERPVRIAFHPPPGSGWEAATQLVPDDGPLTFTAPDRDYFLDSPTELARLTVREWEVGKGPERQTLRLAVHHAGSEADVDAFAEMAERVADETAAVFGGYPRFDHGSYTFIADYLPWVHGDGMEHRNSTILTSTRPLATGATRNLGTLAHEFVHAWSMERLRAASLVPFDFESANMSGELWFGEGFTSYYDDLLLHRAGYRGLEAYLRGLAGGLNTVMHSPGRRFRGPAGMSREAPYVDQAAWIDATNHANSFISYYTYGAALGLGLDLLLRSRSDTSLDAYMRAAWERFGEPEVPYTADDLESLLADVTGDPAFARQFFRRYVRGSELPPYRELLAEVGLVLRRARPGTAFLHGTRLRRREGGVVVAEPTRMGSPLHGAGVARGDRLVALDGRKISRPEDVETVVSRRAPGDCVVLRFEQRDELRTAEITLAEDPTVEIVPVEETGADPTPEARAFREAWLSSRR